MLNPHDADNLTKGVIASLQGDTSSLATLVSQTSTLTETFAGRDQALGEVITNLNKVVGNLAQQNDNLDGVITQTRACGRPTRRRRPELVSSVGSLARVMGRLSASANDVYPALREFIDRQPGVTRHILSVEPQVAFFGDNVPLAAEGARPRRQSGRLRQRLRVRRQRLRVLPRPQRCRADHRQRRHAGKQGLAHPEMQEHRRWLTPMAAQEAPLESYNKTWLGLIAVAVVAVVIGAMLLVHAARRRIPALHRRVSAGRVAATREPDHGRGHTGRHGHQHETRRRPRRGRPEDSRRHRAGQGFQSDDQGRHHPGCALPRGRARGPASLPHNTFELSHTEVPYDLQAALQDATTTFEQVDSDRFAQSLAVLGKQLDGPARGGAAGAGEHRLAVVDHRAAARPTGSAAEKHRAGHQHTAPPASQHRQPGQPRPRPDRCIRRAASGFPRDDAVPAPAWWTC